MYRLPTSLNCVPEQKVPLPVKPLSHWQVKLPAALVHVAFLWQSWISSLHSLTSDQEAQYAIFTYNYTYSRTPITRTSSITKRKIYVRASMPYSTDCISDSWYSFLCSVVQFLLSLSQSLSLSLSPSLSLSSSEMAAPPAKHKCLALPIDDKLKVSNGLESGVNHAALCLKISLARPIVKQSKNIVHFHQLKS